MIAVHSETTETRESAGPASGGERTPAAQAAGPEPSARDQPGTRPISARAYQRRAGILHEEAERLFNGGKPAEAERKVRKLLSLQKRAVGRQHPDYALGLSMLGELRFLQDDLAGAEALFRRALRVRGKVLGHRDPDYAVSLACLGGVLWRRGEIEEAERRFREALAIRYEVLGEDHPESVQSRKELARILRRRGDWAGAHALSDGLSTAIPGRDDLGADVVLIASELARLGEKLGPAARLVGTAGVPLAAADVEDLAECRRLYERVCAEVLRRVEALDVPAPAQRLLDSIQELASLVDDLAEAEGIRKSREELRRRAIAVLERVLRLDYFRNEDFPPLRECQDLAERLVETIESEHWSELPTQTETLSEGTHALVSLLLLVERPQSLSDREWAELHEHVAEAFGGQLASAASRARLVVAEARARATSTATTTTSTRPEAPVAPAESFVVGVTPESQESAPSQPTPPTESTKPARRRSRSQAPRSNTAPPPLDPRAALLRDIAVASLVPTMGKVINLPTASPNERDTHRLLRVGHAPKVVDRPPAPEVESGIANTLHHQAVSAELARRYGTYRRIGGGVIAGPLSLNHSHDAASELMLSQALLGPERFLELLGLPQSELVRRLGIEHQAPRTEGAEAQANDDRA